MIEEDDDEGDDEIEAAIILNKTSKNAQKNDRLFGERPWSARPASAVRPYTAASSVSRPSSASVPKYGTSLRRPQSARPASTGRRSR